MNQILIIGTNSSGTGGVDISHLATYTVQYPKLWSSDSGRNMRGDNKATLIGIFTKLQVELSPAYDAADISQILGVLNGPSTYVKYYDTETQSLRVEDFYFGDIETQLLDAQANKVTLKQFSIIGNKRREL